MTSEEEAPEDLSEDAQEELQPEASETPEESDLSVNDDSLVPGADDETGSLFDMGMVREKIERSKVSKREQEDNLLRQHLEAKAKRVAEDRGVSLSIDRREYLDDSHDGKVRNFDDIFSTFPIGDGEFEVYVERKSPKRYRGTLISGIQRPITERMGYKDFAEVYGMGSYVLTVYGPTPSGRLDDEGKPKRRAFTKPVAVNIPDPYEDNPPNPEMAVVATPDLEEDADMLRQGGRRILGGATEADAHIREVELRHQESAEERQIRIQEDLREREERAREAERRRQDDLATRILDAKERELEVMREELRALRNSPTSEDRQMSGVASILAAVRPNGPTESELQRMTEQLSEERRRNQEEMSRIRDTHRAEMDRAFREKDELLRIERERADNRIREIEDRSRQRESDLRVSLEQRLSDERRQHDRDLQTHRESNLLMSKSGENSFAIQLEVRQAEINRLLQETQRLQSELDSERKKTLADRVNEFSSAAEALGYNKDEGGSEPTFKSMLSDAAMGLIQHAPSLASALRGGGAPALPPSGPQYQQARPLPLMGQSYMHQPAFATEDVEVDLSGSAGYAQPPYRGPESQRGMVAQPQQMQQVPQVPVVSQQQEEEYEEEDQEEDQETVLKDSQIIEFSGMFRTALKEQATPEAFAEGVVQQLGPVVAGSIVRDLPLDRVLSVLQKAPGGDSDPLVRREGKQFLRKIWEIVEQKTS